MRSIAESGWQVGFGPSQALNGALFIREASGLSQRHDPWRAASPWPPVLRGADDRDAARGEWSAWWADLLHRAGDVEALDGPDFPSLADRPALRAACRSTWGPFIHWWEMPAGGRLAIESWDELFRIGATIRATIRAFELRHVRRARPFRLRLDLVHPQTADIHLVGERYAVLAAGCFRPHGRFEGWLTERVAALA